MLARSPDGSLRGERGAVSTQLVLATPALLFMIMLVVQFALYQHASHVVTAAAQHAATEAQGERGSAAAGRRAAEAFLHRSGAGVLHSTEVSVTRDLTRTRAVVRGETVSVVPGFRLAVRGVADAPPERFRGRLER